MSSVISITSQIFIMIVLILCGMFLFKIKWISNDTNRQLSKVVISFVNPALMFYAYNIEFDDRYAMGLIASFLVAIVMHFLFIVASKLLLRNKNSRVLGLERYCSIYSNCAFIGIPLVQAVYGNEGVFYVTAYITVFNLLMWTHGISLVGNQHKFNFVENVLKSPTIIATVLGMCVFFMKIHVPDLVLKPIYYISNLNTPLAMIVSGVTIAQTKILSALKEPKIYLISGIKLMLVPTIVIILFSFLDMNQVALLSTVLVGACPTATASVLLSIQYGNDEEYASRIFGVTTILSAITLPLLVGMGKVICG